MDFKNIPKKHRPIPFWSRNEKLWLVCETPEIFDITVNGASVKNEACGYLRDKSFKKLDISEYAAPGTFYKEPCVWNTNPELKWDDYYFMPFGI